MMSGAAFYTIVTLLMLSPVIIGGAGFMCAAKMRRLRWLLHGFVLLAMPVIGPFLFVWATTPYDGGEPNPGAGLVFLLFLPILAASAVGYVIFVLVLWWSRSHTAASASNG
jgi:hypothetical protein